MRRIFVKPPPRATCSCVSFRAQDKPPLSQPESPKNGAPGAVFLRLALTRAVRNSTRTFFHVVAPTIARPIRFPGELAASKLPERFGSDAPSIRAGDLHRTPETACMKPGSGSPFFRSVPQGNPSEGRPHQLVRRRASWARDELVSGRLVFQDRSFREFPVFHVAPQRDEQFARHATIPIRRNRRLPRPNLPWYHWASALSGW